MKIECKTPQDRPWQTDWEFSMEPELFNKFKEFVTMMAQDLYQRFVCSAYMGSVPAQAEIDEEEDWGWAYCGDMEEIPIFYDGKLNKVVITMDNEPDCSFDRLDPNHEEWTKPSALQWLKVLRIYRMVAEATNLQGLAIFNPFETADWRRAHATLTI